MADEFNAALILIQSLNRASQNSGNVGLTSGSGSGQIEYTTDNLFTIERAVLEHERDNNNKTKTKPKPAPDREGFRYLSLEIVKSRYLSIKDNQKGYPLEITVKMSDGTEQKYKR